MSLGPAAIGVIGLIAGIFLTNFVTKSRERRKHLLEQRDLVYIDVIDKLTDSALRTVVTTLPATNRPLAGLTQEKDEFNRLAARIYIYGSKKVIFWLDEHIVARDAMDQYRVDRVIGGDHSELDVTKERGLVQLNQDVFISAQRVVDQVLRDLGRPTLTDRAEALHSDRNP